MANEVSHRHTATGATLYFTIRNTARQMWNTAGTPNFETLTVANWGDYDIALSESPASSYFYVGTFPAISGNMVAGWYWVDIYSGATAINNTLVASYFGYWDGTTYKWWGNDALAINGVSTSPVTAVNANLGTTQPVNFEGTGASAKVKGDLISILGTVLTESSAGRVAAAFTGLFDTATGVIVDIWNKVITGSWATNSAARILRFLRDAGEYHGAVWIDTVNGTAGTTSYENGTDSLPSLTLADATTIATALGFFSYNLSNGSSVTLTADASNKTFNGYGATVVFGGQIINNARFKDMAVSGVAAGTGGYHLAHCEVNTCTLPPGFVHGESKILGTASLAAGEHYWNNCIADGAAKFDFSPAGNCTLNAHNCNGNYEVLSLGAAGTDVLTLSGEGLLTINASCVGGTINLYGGMRYVNNGSGITINDYTGSRPGTAQTITPPADMALNSTVAKEATLATVAGYIDTEIQTLIDELAKVPKSDGTATWNATALASILGEINTALNTAYTDATVLNAGGIKERLRVTGWLLRNDLAVTNATGAYEVLKDDNFTSALTGTITDNSVTTRRTRAA